MSRSVNKMQSDILLNRMQNNRQIACGFVKLSKDVVAEFWSSLTEELNAAGPPIKNDFEWKKVWTDQKRYVRSKAAANLKSQRGTGGGPNQTKTLSVSEQCIYELVGMKESVEGLESSLSFGLPEGFRDTEKKNEPSKGFHEIVDEVFSEAPTCSKTLAPPPLDSSTNEESAEKRTFSIKRKRVESQEKLTTAELIAKELKSQENLCCKIADIGESLQNHNKEMEVMMKRVYRSLEKSNDLKSKKLKELERHNAVVEKLRAKEVENKIEKNKKLLEIENIKLEILMKNK